ncbi:hypothetical protein KKF81_04245 [Candidatus Micrarchaeota archaeon]|nr:hypothetical protein [Candidatus Micrarchaeota archaeon]
MTANQQQTDAPGERQEQSVNVLNQQQVANIVNACTMLGLNPEQVLGYVRQGQRSGVDALLDGTTTTREMNFADLILDIMGTGELAEDMVQDAVIRFNQPGAGNAERGMVIDEETRDEMRARLYQLEHPEMNIEEARRESLIDYESYRATLADHHDAPLRELAPAERKVMQRERRVNAILTGAYSAQLADESHLPPSVAQGLLERATQNDPVARELALAVRGNFEHDRQGRHSVQNLGRVMADYIRENRHTLPNAEEGTLTNREVVSHEDGMITTRIPRETETETNTQFRTFVEQAGGEPAGVRWCLDRLEHGETFSGVDAEHPNVRIATALRRQHVSLNDLDHPNSTNLRNMRIAVLSVRGEENVRPVTQVAEAVEAAPNEQTEARTAPQYTPRNDTEAALAARLNEVPGINIPRVFRYLQALEQLPRTRDILRGNDPNVVVAWRLYEAGVRITGERTVEEQQGVSDAIGRADLQFSPARSELATQIETEVRREGGNLQEVNIYLSRLVQGDVQTFARDTSDNTPRAPHNENERIAIGIYTRLRNLAEEGQNEVAFLQDLLYSNERFPNLNDRIIADAASAIRVPEEERRGRS